jgi:hypothetical protein
MMEYNEKLAKSGALISLDGLHPPASAVRFSFVGGRATAAEGPFAVSTNVLGGYWMIQVKSKQEALEWARQVPANDGDIVEVRQVFEMEEFPEEVQKAADKPAVRAQVDKARK